MTDQEILQGLIAHDEKITQYFFFNKCQPIFFHAINKIFDSKADYDELVNELYTHLMESDARRLRMFEGRSNIYSWLSSVAKNFFLEKKNHERLIEKEHDDSLNKEAGRIIDESSDRPDQKQEEEDMRVAAILDQIENERYRLVIEKHVLEGMSFDELEKLTGISKANLYNIKMRALKKVEQIMKIARSKSDSLCAVRCEQYILHCFGIHKSLDELRDLATAKGWLTEDGARIQDLGNTSKEFGLRVEKLSDASLQDIMKALDDGRQVIAAVDGGELIGDLVEERLEDVFAGGIVDHCVVVLGVDVDMDEVALYDPAFGPIPLSVSIAHFMDAWADSNYHCVLIFK
ncbi:MAG: sigma-70 family RNA polymerase sigma factor [Bacteroidales bacterium]|nr:sigma-70 family RNA polymerase sigma factor [Bacteroidales bacterium]